ncbi:MAG TPA: hypothetical protein PKX91_04420 [Clostridia bacterium]|jgi:hypothetical protein|nr:hypothetical protein [Clostridia bacterium]
MRRKEVIKDYKLEPSEDTKGKIKTKAVYIGEKYAITADKHLLNQYRFALIIISLILFAIVLAPLIFDMKSTYSWYVVMSGLVVLLLIIVSAIKRSSIFSKKEILTRKEFFDIKAAKESLSLGKLVMLCIHIICKIIFISVESKTEFLTLELVGLFLTTVAITLSIVEYVLLQQITLVKVGDAEEDKSSEDLDSVKPEDNGNKDLNLVQPEDNDGKEK